jgi:N-acetylneuraminic acid mutarotase
MSLFRKSLSSIALASLVAFTLACGGGGGGGSSGGSSNPPPADPPVATSLVAASSTVTSGTPVNLTPTFSGGSGVITPGNLPATSGTAVSVTPTATTTYTLTVTNSAGATASTSTTVTTVAAPSATSLVAASSALTLGQSTTLTPTFSNGTGKIGTTLGGNNIATSATSGVAVSITPSSTATYYLTVTNSAGTTASVATSVVVVAEPVATSLVAASSSITLGQSTTLTPTFSNGTGKIGTSSGGSNTTSSATSGVAVSVTPTVNTTYYLTVSNSAGSTATKNTSVAVVGPWASTGVLTLARTQHVSTLLPNGKVLVVGGADTNTSSTAGFTAELYDPTSGVWARTGSLIVGRRNGHSATLLPNGKVMVTGGSGVNKAGSTFENIYTTELYDPQTGAWEQISVAGTNDYLKTPRTKHTATLLPNGKVLITGGLKDGTSISAAELYDPATGSWTSAGSFSISPRVTHTATLLSNGKVLVSGGWDSNGGAGYLQSAELYDYQTGTWSATGSMSVRRAAHTATLLPNGKVLVAGGYGGDGNNLSSAELYDPATGSWASTGSLSVGVRQSATATLLPSGKVLVVGGTNSTNGIQNNNTYLSSTELYDPETGSWSGMGSLAIARLFHTTTLLPNGKVLVAGGTNGSQIASCELFTIPGVTNPGTWATPQSMGGRRGVGHSVNLLPNNKVLLTGGRGNSSDTDLNSYQLFDISLGAWEDFASTTKIFLSGGRSSHISVTLSNGKVLIAGGSVGGNLSKTSQIYSVANDSWSSSGNMIQFRWSGTAALALPNGKVLVIGGTDATGNLSSCELYDPATGVWSSTGSMTSARSHHTATLLPNGKVLVSGGFTTIGTNHASAEIYDPQTGNWSPAGSLITARGAHTAVLLPNGKLMVIGGYAGTGSGPLSSCEFYDTNTNTWSSAPSTITPRNGHTAILLPNGKVLVTGGWTGTYSTSCELFDFNNSTWSTTGSLSWGRTDHKSILLPNGKAMVIGGGNNDSTSETYTVGF